MRAFLVGLLLIWGTCFGLPLLTALGGSLQPLEGDLTRIGGLSERDYGWNEPQLRFDRLSTARFGSIAALARAGIAYDFLVIGDSFSEAGVGNPHVFGFQEWIQAALGNSVATIPQAQIDYERLVCDLKNMSTPPRYVVFQTAERYLENRIEHLESATAASGTCAQRRDKPYIRAQISKIALQTYQRPTSLTWHTVYGVYFSRMAAMLGGTMGYARNSVEIFSLTKPDLFSSLRSGDLLVVNEDLGTRPSDAARIRQAVQGLADLMSREAGSTFILLVSPNKLSAYHRYVSGPSPEPVSPMLRAGGVPMADVDMEISALITQGYRDVYLPDDTHWGYRGHCAAARAIAKYISSGWHFRGCEN